MARSTYFSFPLPKVPESADPKLVDALQPLYNGMFAIYNDFLYSCGVIPFASSEYARLESGQAFTVQPQNLNRLVVVAKENLAYGSLVALELVSGVVKAKLALGGAGGIRAIGHCATAGGVNTGEKCEIVVGTGLLGVTGATVGTTYYLGTTAGTISTSPPGSGVIQRVGFGLLPDYIYMNYFQS